MKTVKINVTKYQIENGTRVSPYNCPIARAIRRNIMIKGDRYKDVSVGADNVDIFSLPKTVNVKLPKEAKEFIRRFDSGLPVKPFSFTLRVPDKFAK